ncbi:MAG TPA: hypothetical protein VGP72_02975 [Planctomycetota bacterium]|jgi:hypothetical protein
MLTRISDRWLTAALIVLPLLLLARCWNAEFIAYDDADHVQFALRPQNGFPQVFQPAAGSTYFPITLLSYRLDAQMFWWMVPSVGTWAPGVRLMTALYHGAAALILWKLLQELGVKRGAAYFIALVFAIHPMACETVCWASERKNALSALFGFVALWVQVRYFERCWVLPASGSLWLLAAMSKPSALGLLPLLVLFVVVDGRKFFCGRRAECPLTPSPSPSRGRGEPAGTQSGRIAPTALHWRALAVALLGVATWRIITFNMMGHSETLVEPPGGSIFTAILTDSEIIARYIYNLFVPDKLSAAYYVAPIFGLGDIRLWGYGALLLGLVIVTVWIAENRRLALLGWFWFFVALGPVLNLVALAQLMQDRFVYLSTPGLLLVFAEAYAGMAARIKFSPQLTGTLASVYVAALLGGAMWRGGIYTDMFSLFHDAAQKQPQAAYAHECLAVAYTQQAVVLRRSGRDAEALEASHGTVKEILTFLDCPDAPRYLAYASLALDAGKYLSEKKNDSAGGLRCFELAMRAPRGPPKVKNEAKERYQVLLAKMGRP